MELYTTTSYELSRRLTERYSTSFSLSSSLFSTDIQPHIYAIYGLVRIADEIVDTYKKSDANSELKLLHDMVKSAIKSGYSTNPIVHAFACTVRNYKIEPSLINSFFESMQSDLTFNNNTTTKQYQDYIYGSAEVVGLMCLKIFTGKDDKLYAQLQKGAQALGAAYQKINFLRDIKDDYEQLGRVYFPGVKFETFNDDDKNEIIADIEADLKIAAPTISKLPIKARRAVAASYNYYYRLLQKLQKTPANTIKSRRIRLPNIEKGALLVKSRLSTK